MYDNGYELIMNRDMHEYEVQLRMKGMQVGIGNTDCICQQKSRLCNTIWVKRCITKVRDKSGNFFRVKENKIFCLWRFPIKDDSSNNAKCQGYNLCHW